MKKIILLALALPFLAFSEGYICTLRDGKVFKFLVHDQRVSLESCSNCNQEDELIESVDMIFLNQYAVMERNDDRFVEIYYQGDFPSYDKLIFDKKSRVLTHKSYGFLFFNRETHFKAWCIKDSVY